MAKSPLIAVSLDPHCNSHSGSDFVGSSDGHPCAWDGWDGWISVQTQPSCPEVDPFNDILRILEIASFAHY